MGYSPYGCKESDTTEVTWHARTHSIRSAVTGPSLGAAWGDESE